MDTKSTTVVQHGPALTAAVWVGGPVLGGVGGWFLPGALEWAAGLPWAPFQGLMEAVVGLPQPWLGIGAVGLGVVGGLFLSGAVRDDALTVTVTGGEVELRHGQQVVRLDRADAAVAFTEDDRLAILAVDGRELARTPCLLADGRLERAFQDAGIGWSATDPYDGDYLLWVAGRPGMPPGADALLTARAKAVQREDRSDRDELRAELVRLGVVVRDRKGKQYSRRTPAVTTS